MHDDQVERLVRERKRMEWRDLKFRLWNTAAREVDRLVCKIDPCDLPEKRPSRLPSEGSLRDRTPHPADARRVEGDRRAEPFRLSGSPGTTSAFVRCMDSLVVVDGDAGGQSRAVSRVEVYSGRLSWLPSSG